MITAQFMLLAFSLLSKEFNSSSMDDTTKKKKKEQQKTLESGLMAFDIYSLSYLKAKAGDQTESRNSKSAWIVS